VALALPTTELGIAKLALYFLGVSTRITDVTTPGTSKEEIGVNNFYNVDLDEVLKEGEWRFAQRRALLTEITGSAWSSATAYTTGQYVTKTNAAGNAAVWYALQSGTNHEPTASPTYWEQVSRDEWTYAYTLPSDFLAARFIYPRKSRIQYDIESGPAYTTILLTNEEDADLIYTARVSTITKWSAGFIKAFAWKLAADLAAPLQLDEKKVVWADGRYKAELSKALAADLKQTQDDIQANESSSFLDARR
jgi:hypothetical protein